ncbi:MAG: leucine-rich repeat domain-containing protein [Bacteroidaceae bacterium]|nr:leucine-rich repeat domain-containing protein [Bacteroidaceae bacterium]
MKHSSLTILLAILISLVGVKAFAYEFEIDGIYYKSNRTGMTVTSGPEKYSGSIVIPATITFNGITLSVTTIGDGAFEFCSDLTSITLPNSVTSIETGAFAGCSELTSIIIPESVTSIGTSAFSGCTGLTSIIIPESVTSIGS